jgi:lysozyme
MGFTPDVIDIYRGNDIQDYDKLVAQGILGIIHKATEGASLQDSMYAYRRKMQNNRFLWGAYHFNSESSSIAAQVANYLSVAEPDAKTLLALDWEGGSAQAYSPSEAREFLELLMSKTGRQPKDIWIYGGNVLREKIDSPEDAAFFGQFKLWHCQYGTSHPNICKAWKTFDLFQYSETGKLDGTGSKVDLNIYNGDALALRAAWAPGTGKPSVPILKPSKGGGFWDWFRHH